MLSNSQVERLARAALPHIVMGLEDSGIAASNERWAQEWLGMSYAEAEQKPIDSISDRIDRWLASILGADETVQPVECVEWVQKEAHAPT